MRPKKEEEEVGDNENFELVEEGDDSFYTFCPRSYDGGSLGDVASDGRDFFSDSRSWTNRVCD